MTAKRPLVTHLSMYRGRRTACGLVLRHSDVVRSDDPAVVTCRQCKRSVYFHSLKPTEKG